MHIMSRNFKTSLMDKGFLGNLKDKNICFNPKPFSRNSENVTQMNENNSDFVDFHLEVVEKVDRLLAEFEKEEKVEKKVVKKRRIHNKS